MQRERKGKKEEMSGSFFGHVQNSGVTMPLKPYDDLCYIFLRIFLTVFVVSVQVA